MKKKENKSEKLTESSHLTVEMTRRSNYDLNLRKLCINKITAELQSDSKWKTSQLAAMMLHSSFDKYLSIHSLKDKCNFAVCNEDSRKPVWVGHCEIWFCSKSRDGTSLCEHFNVQMCCSLTDSLRFRYFEIILQVDTRQECPYQKDKNCQRSIVSGGPNVICGSDNLPNVDQN